MAARLRARRRIASPQRLRGLVCRQRKVFATLKRLGSSCHYLVTLVITYS
jgi:hypothetical protein